jgi:hypothetical protein
MLKKLILFFLVISFKIFAQDKYEYFGALKLNGDDKTVISYRILFVENNGVLNGFSITDIGGKHETKNIISGSYNKKTKEINFREERILYTKSAFTAEAFCFVNFSGKVKLINDNSKLEGDFKGLYNNKQKCIDGTLLLIGSNKLYKLLGKINNKIQNSKRVDVITKKKANPLRILDSLKINNLLKGENLNVFVNSKSVEIEIWDAKIEDGDIIQLFQNDKLILDHYEVKNKKKKILVYLEKNQNVFKIEAVNEGDRSPNTAEINLIDGERNFELKSNLKKGESATITFIN